MAELKTEISAERMEAGARILALTDQIAFGAVGAAWVYSRESETWCYVLVTPMIDSRGPRWIFDRLLKVFQRYPLPEGVTPLDLRVISPKEQWFTRFPLKARNNLPGPLPAFAIHDLAVPGMTPVDYAYIYRMDFTERFGGDRARAFERRVNELLAA